MRKLIISMILGGLLLTAVGCGGGGGGGSNTGNGGGGDDNPVINIDHPGNYPINRYYTAITDGNQVTVLLKSVDLSDDLKLKCNFSWSARVNSNQVVEKKSDQNNTKMYFRDNLGNTYPHYQGEGIAYTDSVLTNGATKTGAYYFDLRSLPATATSLTFHDDDQQKKIGPILIQRGAVNNNARVRETIDQYFKGYFDSQRNLSLVDLNRLLADNDNIQLNEAYRATVVEEQRLFNTGIASYQYRIDYRNLVINADQAEVDLQLDLDFYYKNAPAGMRSAIHGLNYHFTLKPEGTRWQITQIDTDLLGFKVFKDQVQQTMTQNPSLKRSEAIRRTGQLMRSNFQMMRQNSVYLQGEPVSQSGNGGISDNNFTTQSVFVTYTNYPYNPANGAKYARKYATAPVNERLFYTAYRTDEYGRSYEVDCTNFVSQCIWAGYGGYVDGATTQNQNNIANKIRMVPNVWHAGTGGGMPNWENAGKFWDYLISSKTAGPQGTAAYSDQRLYTATPAESINIGDVLQFWYDGYSHSVYVSDKQDVNRNGKIEYSEIYICSHTNNRRDVSLQSIINTFYRCYMRKITPVSPRPFLK